MNIGRRCGLAQLRSWSLLSSPAQAAAKRVKCLPLPPSPPSMRGSRPTQVWQGMQASRLTRLLTQPRRSSPTPVRQTRQHATRHRAHRSRGAGARWRCRRTARARCPNTRSFVVPLATVHVRLPIPAASPNPSSRVAGGFAARAWSPMGAQCLTLLHPTRHALASRSVRRAVQVLQTRASARMLRTSLAPRRDAWPIASHPNAGRLPGTRAREVRTSASLRPSA